MTRNGYGLERAFRSALFQVVSFITTTGLFNDDAAMWPHITWVILGCLMFVGACSGSTTGGFKCVRLVMVLKVLRNEFHKLLHPNAVFPVKINGVPVPRSQLSTLLAFFAIFTLMVLFTATLMIALRLVRRCRGANCPTTSSGSVRSSCSLDVWKSCRCWYSSPALSGEIIKRLTPTLPIGRG